MRSPEWDRGLLQEELLVPEGSGSGAQHLPEAAEVELWPGLPALDSDVGLTLVLTEARGSNVGTASHS